MLPRSLLFVFDILSAVVLSGLRSLRRYCATLVWNKKGMKRPSFDLPDPIWHPTKEFLDNPYPILAQMRQAPVMWSKAGEYWLISSYEEVNAVFRDVHYEKGFQRWKTVTPLLKLIPQLAEQLQSRNRSMLNVNPPDHTRLRSLVNKAFSPSMVSGMRDHIAGIATKLIDQVEAKGEMDVINDFAFVLPLTVIAEMLGIPVSDRERLRQWSHALTEALEPSAAMPKMLMAAKANKEMTDYLRPLVDERRQNPASDLISALVQAEEEGSKLTVDELMANLVLLLVAGHETTVNLIGNSVIALLRNPEQYALLKAQPELIDSAVDEFLRYDSPVQLVRRIAGSDLELGGQQILEGDTVMLLTGAANHDPEQFATPEKLDITRQNNKYLSFGAGIHHCLGSSLAKAEGRIALSTLLTRLPNLKLKNVELDYRRPFALRGVKAIPVTF